MMELAQELMESGKWAVTAAFLLGLLTAVSPCPLATNIAAVGYITKGIESRRGVFLNGLLYALGRIIAYTILGALLIGILRGGASIYGLQKTISTYGETLLGPVMLLMGVAMLLAHKINLPQIGFWGAGGTGETNVASRLRGGAFGSLLLGMLFALAFCPSSGLFYFGMLIPMSATANGGYFLPVVFGLGTALPVVVAAWVLAFSIANIAKAYNAMKAVETWLRNIIGGIFIFTGIYFTYIYFFQ